VESREKVKPTNTRENKRGNPVGRNMKATSSNRVPDSNDGSAGNSKMPRKSNNFLSEKPPTAK
jgi:hypothetical protein